MPTVEEIAEAERKNALVKAEISVIKQSLQWTIAECDGLIIYHGSVIAATKQRKMEAKEKLAALDEKYPVVEP